MGVEEGFDVLSSMRGESELGARVIHTGFRPQLLPSMLDPPASCSALDIKDLIPHPTKVQAVASMSIMIFDPDQPLFDGCRLLRELSSAFKLVVIHIIDHDRHYGCMTLFYQGMDGDGHDVPVLSDLRRVKLEYSQYSPKSRT